MNVLQIIYIPHKRNNRKTDFVHITTESGRDIKMTLAHIIPAGKCSDDSLPLSLPLAYAEKGKLRTKNDGILCSIFFSFFVSFFLSFFFLFFSLLSLPSIDVTCQKYLINSVTHLLPLPHSHSLTDALARWLIRQSTYLHTLTYLPTHSLALSFSRPLTYLLTWSINKLNPSLFSTSIVTVGDCVMTIMGEEKVMKAERVVGEGVYTVVTKEVCVISIVSFISFLLHFIFMLWRTDWFIVIYFFSQEWR